jgi:beta-glucosidase
VTTFPSGFSWGAATSAHQIEGNNVNSDWWRMENAKPSLMAEPSGDACDSYHRYGHDIELLSNAGLGVYRFSIEWARIEPAPGEFSRAALDHYQRMIDTCHTRGVEPVITLHHFTNPRWLREDDGGWIGTKVIDRYARYAETVMSTLTGLSRVCTINEPNMISTFAGVLSGTANLAPGGEPVSDPRICQTLIAAHRKAVDAIRGAGADAGLTHAMTAYTSDGSAHADAAIATIREFDEDVFIDAAREDDFLGVQAYTRRFATTTGSPVGTGIVHPHGHEPAGPAARQTGTGWNYYPQSIGDCLHRAATLAPATPLIVTENGIATTNDDERIAYTTGALQSVHAAISDGIDVRGYWHWSLLDNFEWIHGYGPTFGLIAVDRTTFTRTPKPSLDWLGRIAKANTLPT